MTQLSDVSRWFPRCAVTLVLAVLVQFGGYRTAGADEQSPAKGGPSEADRDAARMLYEEAMVHYNVGEYRPALGLFKQAYKKFPTPAFLYNMAQAHRLMGNCRQALVLYRTYLRQEANSPNRGEIERLVQATEACTRQPTPGRAREPAQPSPAGTRQRGGEPAAALRPAPSPTPTSPTSPPLLERSSGARGDVGFWTRRRTLVVGVAAAGLGLAMAGTGAWFAVDAARAADEVSDRFAAGGQWDDDIAAIERRGERSEKLAIGLVAGGAAVAVAGALVTGFGWHAPGQPGHAVDIALRGRNPQLVWIWEF
jgi:tetratricopeptide (TPR) repeat protein